MCWSQIDGRDLRDLSKRQTVFVLTNCLSSSDDGILF